MTITTKLLIEHDVPEEQVELFKQTFSSGRATVNQQTMDTMLWAKLDFLWLYETLSPKNKRKYEKIYQKIELDYKTKSSLILDEHQKWMENHHPCWWYERNDKCQKVQDLYDSKIIFLLDQIIKFEHDNIFFNVIKKINWFRIDYLASKVKSKIKSIYSQYSYTITKNNNNNADKLLPLFSLNNTKPLQYEKKPDFSFFHIDKERKEKLIETLFALLIVDDEEKRKRKREITEARQQLTLQERKTLGL